MLVMHTPDDTPELGEGPELATMEQRLGAFLIDTILNGGLVVAAFAFSGWCSNGELWFNDSGGLFGFIPTLAILLFIWTIYVLSKVASTGQTVGKNQVGIKTILVESTIKGEEIQLGLGTAFAREIIGKNVLGPLTLGLGLLAPLFSERRQGLQDKVAETIVVKSEQYEEWIYWIREGKWQLELELKNREERWELELRRIEDDKRFRATQEREYERMMQDRRAVRDEINRRFGESETDEEKRERLQDEVLAEVQLRRERDQKLIEDEKNQRAYYKRELQRIIQDDRAGRERVNTLRRKSALRGNDDEEGQRAREEERAGREFRNRLERAMGLNKTDNSGN